MLTHRRVSPITVVLPLSAFLVGSALVVPASGQGEEVRWYHLYGRDGFLGWYLPRSDRLVKHQWPVTLVWFDETERVWYYTSNPDILDAVDQLMDANLDVGNFADERTFASAIHFHSTASDRSSTSTRWVRIDRESYLEFPTGLSAYLHEIGRVQSPQPEGGVAAPMFPAPAGSSLTCCRTIIDLDCLWEVTESPPAAPRALPQGGILGCDDLPGLGECETCTVCCDSWSDGCQGAGCEQQSCSAFTVECEWHDCHSHECVPGEGCVQTWLCGEAQECETVFCNDAGACDQEDWPDGTPCTPDDNLCTYEECLGGTCTSTTIHCDDNNECTSDSCDPGTGCVFEDKPDGTGCDDEGNPCTEDVCVDGVCTHPPKDCDDDRECTSDGCNAETGACVNLDLAPGTPCSDDGNECTLDHCLDGNCVHPDVAPGTPCSDDGNECTLDYCLSGNCVHPRVADGTACTSDGDPCTDDICQTGACANPPVDCDDGKPCTNDSCDPTNCLGACPCLFECKPEGCGLLVETLPLTVCPGGTGYLEFETNNTSECSRWIRVVLTDTSAGTIVLDPLPSPGFKLHQPGEPKSWSVPISVSASSPTGNGSITINVSAFGNGCQDTHCTDGTVTVAVPNLDLEIHNGGADLDHGDALGPQGSAVAEADEEDIGGFVLVNWDDDDGDGVMNPDGSWTTAPVPDLEESSVTDEDNLAKLVPKIQPIPLDGSAELEIVQGADKIKLWSTRTKGTEFLPGATLKTWSLGDPTERDEFQQLAWDGLWMEGIAPSDAERDIILVLRYRQPGGHETCTDTVKATVVMINLANAVYRDNQIWTQGDRGHAALVWTFTGPLLRANLNDDAKFLIIEIAGPTDDKPLTTMTQAGETVYGCFTNPSITYVERLKILQAAKSLVGSDFGYPVLGAEAIEPSDWDGKLNTITKMRCDGLVEVCYEINGVEVWGMARAILAGQVHYDITSQSDLFDYDPVLGLWELGGNGLPGNLEEHNDFDSVGWADTLQPATQCGHVTPEDADTRFQKQDLCIPVGSKGGN